MTTLFRRTFLSLAMASGALAAVSPAFAQGFPNHPLKLVSPFPPGGQTDIVARLIAQPLGEALGQPVIVEPRAGGNGTVGMTYAAKAPADGYTLVIANAGIMTIAGTFDPNLPYSATRDFAPLILAAGSPSVITVNAKVPANTLAEFVALAKKQPGKLNYGGVSPDSFSGLLLEQFRLQAGTTWTTVSYKSTGNRIADLVGGQVDFTIDNISSSIEYIKAGQVRALVTSRKSPLLPGVPTFKETGYDLQDALAWHGILVPKNTPPDVVNRLNAEIGKLLKRPEIIKKFQELGLEVLGGTPAEFESHIASETVRWNKVLKDAGIKGG